MDIGKLMRIHAINWIPDFQHKVYPENFSKEECKEKIIIDRQSVVEIRGDL